ncbi:MAG TPA: DUF1615 domain-containing protein [Casimicrobiaceae bacterium]|nr:DUF1615 domain-containing protein [Casimicrobiaceae bacterium]
MNRCARHAVRAVSAFVVAILASCATTEPSGPTGPVMTAEEARAFVARLIPDGVTDRAGWSTDIYAAMASLRIAPTADNVCAIVAVTEQESGFRVDPTVPGLAAIAAKEIERQRERAGIPRMALDTALSLSSSNGKTYAERLRTVTTEAELSQLFDDLIGRVPLGRTFFADRNPVRTGGPMQVSVAYAQAHTAAKAYPYPIHKSVRDEVFSRRGGMYFGIAHLLDYPASYDKVLYRFADFNAGHYASRNAAFQLAVTQASGVPLALDGDLLRYDDGRPAREAGNTEQALRALAPSLGMSQGDIRADLELEKDLRFERTRLYARVFDLAERRSGKAWPNAAVPRIALKSPKITRNLTSEWFASRVDQRHKRCLARAPAIATRAPLPY